MFSSRHCCLCKGRRNVAIFRLPKKSISYHEVPIRIPILSHKVIVIIIWIKSFFYTRFSQTYFVDNIDSIRIVLLGTCSVSERGPSMSHRLNWHLYYFKITFRTIEENQLKDNPQNFQTQQKAFDTALRYSSCKGHIEQSLNVNKSFPVATVERKKFKELFDVANLQRNARHTPQYSNRLCKRAKSWTKSEKG